VLVSICPEDAEFSVAEAAVLLLMLCFRKSGTIRDAVRRDDWVAVTEARWPGC